MNTIIVYVHGKGGSIEEAAHYKALFDGCKVIGFDYHSNTPWEAKAEFGGFFNNLSQSNDRLVLVANSIGAYFCMHALTTVKIEKAFFISPIVDMETLIENMMTWAKVTEKELYEKGIIETSFGEPLSWEYLRFVRENSIVWHTPTSILYGENDTFTSYDSMLSFCNRIGGDLTVMKGGEHWFHTSEQMAFLDEWIKERY